jgi:hypothetical protein
MTEKYNELRRKHERLIYHDFTVSQGRIRFHFSIDEFRFEPEWTFDLPIHGDLSLFAFNLGMAELVSYWKCACPPLVEVQCGALCEWQTAWWKKLYRNGLGEFFYRNGIEPGDDFMQIRATGGELPLPEKRELGGCLIPVGGGKDSIVTMELLKNCETNNLAYIINPRRPVLETAYLAGFADGEVVGVRRTIDPTLLELNKRGYLNGHTPFSSVIAFSGVLFAYLAGKKYIVLSNESSANEANVKGTDVNHQYSKSAEFERDFREYSLKVFGGSPEYFSLLRPWSEWQIVREFVKEPKYLNVFQSCNVGSKTDVWCGKCAKCLYVYIMLSAFLEQEDLIPIFGGNLLDLPELEGIFNGLLYDSEEKPFECVGTRSEVNLALSRTLEKHSGDLPFLLRKYAANPRGAPASLDDYFDEDNYVPEEFLRLLR